MAGTHPPPADNAIPAGISPPDPSAAPFVDSTANDKSLSGSVKNSLDSVAQEAPSTRSVTDSTFSNSSLNEPVKHNLDSVAQETPSTRSVTDSTSNNTSLSDAVKHSLDSVAQETPSTGSITDQLPSTRSVTDQLPSTRSVTDQLPSTSSVTDQLPSTRSVTDQLPSAQSAADVLKAGASSLVAGISNLALSFSSAANQNAADSHPESEKAHVDDFHVPGAFESATSDREDLADVQRGLQSVSNAMPSTQAVKETIPGIDSQRSITDQAQAGARSAQDQVQQGANYLRDQLPGQQPRSESDQIHKDGTEYIKGQVENRNISSVGAASTTNQLAGQVPLEPQGSALPQVVADSQSKAGGAAPIDDASGLTQFQGQTESRDVPQTVIDSQRKADVSPEASANAEAVREKHLVEEELQHEVPKQSSHDSTAAKMGAAVSGGVATATAAVASAATSARNATRETTGTDPVSVLPVTAQKAIDGEHIQPNSSLQTGDVPGVVVDSQQKAGVSPEASANAEAVKDKTLLEQELKREVPQQSAGSGAAANIRETIAGGIAAAGEKAAQVTGTNPVSVLPQTTQRSIDENTPVNSTSHSNPIGEPQSNFSSSLAHPDLSSGVHNNVVGNHLDDPQTSDKVLATPQVGESAGSAPVAHITNSLRDVDLKSGVHNGIVGNK